MNVSLLSKCLLFTSADTRGQWLALHVTINGVCALLNGRKKTALDNALNHHLSMCWSVPAAKYFTDWLPLQTGKQGGNPPWKSLASQGVFKSVFKLFYCNTTIVKAPFLQHQWKVLLYIYIQEIVLRLGFIKKAGHIVCTQNQAIPAYMQNTKAMEVLIIMQNQDKQTKWQTKSSVS